MEEKKREEFGKRVGREGGKRYLEIFFGDVALVFLFMPAESVPCNPLKVGLHRSDHVHQ